MNVISEFKKQFHILPLKEHCILFHPSTFSTVKIGGKWSDILGQISQGLAPDVIASQLNISVAEISDLLESIQSKVSHVPSVKEDVASSGQSPTLYLNVSSKCNLKCAYCYANFGAYLSEAETMSYEVAIQAVDRFIQEFGRIDTIVFFGGEPLLKTDLISRVCEYSNAEFKKKGLPAVRYSIVTNGTLLTPANVDLMSKYRFGMTVSVDGPEKIHNALRPKVGGQGSFSEVSSGLQRLKEKGIIPNIECTITSKHFQMGYMPKDVMQFCQEQYGTKTITVAPVAALPSEEVSLSTFYDAFIPRYVEAVRYSLESYLSDAPIGLIHVQSVVQYLLRKVRKPKNQFCYADLGENLFSVSAKGSVYPCQMMNDRPEYKMGNVSEEGLRELPQFREVRNTFESMNKDHMQCKNCWAQGLCFMCVAGIEIETHKLSPIPKHRCDLMKAVIDEILIFLSEIRQDETKWDLFSKNFYETTS